MEKYVKILRETGLKTTLQRLQIMKYLDEKRNHPTANKIFSDLKRENPALSKTTVYNSLETLRKHNVIQVLTISEPELRYDINTKPHHHLLCRSCGAIIDVYVNCPYLGKTLSEGRIEDVHGYFEGTCKKCLEKIRKGRKK